MDRNSGIKNSIINALNSIANSRHVYIFLIIISAYGTLWFAYYWFNNAAFAYPRILKAFESVQKKPIKDSELPRTSSLSKNKKNISDTTSNLSPKEENEVQTISLLDYITTVDLSTVTTALPTVTAFFITFGFLSIYQVVSKKPAKGEIIDSDFEKRCHNLQSGYFPFWSSHYKDAYLYWGLLGTLFAFIIAFTEAQQMTDADPGNILLTSLGTALWSSFSAILLAMMPITQLFHYIFINRILSVDNGENDEDIDKILEKLTQTTKNTDSAFEALIKSSNELTESLDRNNVENVIKQLQALQKGFNKLKEKIVSTVHFDNKITHLNEQTKTVEDKVDKCLECLNTLKEDTQKKIEENHGSIDTLKKQLNELISKLRNIS